MAIAQARKSGSRLAGLALGVLSLVSPGAGSSAELGKKGKAIAPKVDEENAAVLLKEQLGELITTNGEGTILTKPDSMRVEIGVEVQAKTLDQVQRQLTRRMQLVTNAIEKLGQEGLVLRTEMLRIQPIESESKGGMGSRIIGFRGQNTLSITLRGVDPMELGARAAQIVDAGVGSGANLVHGISFFLAHPEEAQAKALHLATLDAERNAQILAASAGVKLEKLHSIEGNPERVIPYLSAKVLAARAATTIEPGELTITARVAARFHFGNL